MPRNFSRDVRARRARELYFWIGLVVTALLLRLGSLQLAEGKFFRELSQNNRIRNEVIRAERGRILDRAGVVLADNFPSSRLTLHVDDPLFRKEPERRGLTLAALAEILDSTPEDLERRLARARDRGERPAQLARNLTFEQVSRVEERLDRLTGVSVEVLPVRRYPGGTLACHTLGHLGEVHESELDVGGPYRLGDQVGRVGIERQYEDQLRGTHGEAYVEVDALGRRSHFFPELPSRDAVPGHDIVLTLDARLQRAAETALREMRIQHPSTDADRVTPPASSLVALDPRTGEVLALASYPVFDPNQFVRGLTFEEWRALDEPSLPLLHRAIQSSYPPASTFKPAVALAGLRRSLVSAEKHFPKPCWGHYVFGNRAFRCWKSGGHGDLDLMDAIAQSCDVYFYQLGIALGIEGIADFGVEAGLGGRTGIDLPQERRGLVPTLEWYDERYGAGGIGGGAALNLSIGQGELLMSPLALAQFYAAMANGGLRLRPHLLREVRDAGGTLVRHAAEESWLDGELPSSPADLAVVRAALERVVMHERGTGKRARVDGIAVAGKTGTGQNPHGEDHATFAAYAPAEDPQIVVTVMAENAGGGGAVAAPAAGAVLRAFFAQQGLDLGELVFPDPDSVDRAAGPESGHDGDMVAERTEGEVMGELR